MKIGPESQTSTHKDTNYSYAELEPIETEYAVLLEKVNLCTV